MAWLLMVMPPLPLQVHAVQQLVLPLPVGNCLCGFQQAVGQGAFPVIYVGYDAKVSYIFHKNSSSPFRLWAKKQK